MPLVVEAPPEAPAFLTPAPDPAATFWSSQAVISKLPPASAAWDLFQKEMAKPPLAIPAPRPIDPRDLLLRAAAIMRRGWVKGCIAARPYYRPDHDRLLPDRWVTASPFDREATKFCAMGALIRAWAELGYGDDDEAWEALRARDGSLGRVFWRGQMGDALARLRLALSPRYHAQLAAAYRYISGRLDEDAFHVIASVNDYGATTREQMVEAFERAAAA